MSSLLQCPNCKNYNCFHKSRYYESRWYVPDRKSDLKTRLDFIWNYYIIDTIFAFGLSFITVFILTVTPITIITIILDDFIVFPAFKIHLFNFVLKELPDTIPIIWRVIIHLCNILWVLITSTFFFLLIGRFIRLFLPNFHRDPWTKVMNYEYVFIPSLLLNKIYGSLKYHIINKNFQDIIKVLNCKKCGISIPSEQIYDFSYLLEESLIGDNLLKKIELISGLLRENDFVVNWVSLPTFDNPEGMPVERIKKLYEMSLRVNHNKFYENDKLKDYINESFNCLNDKERIKKATALFCFSYHNPNYDLRKLCKEGDIPEVPIDFKLYP